MDVMEHDITVCFHNCCLCFDEHRAAEERSSEASWCCFPAIALTSCDVPSTPFRWKVAGPVLLPVSLVV